MKQMSQFISRFATRSAIVMGAMGLPYTSAYSATQCTISPGAVVYAQQCIGADAGQQIASALSVLGANSGTVDARGVTTPKNITTALSLGTAWTNSVSLFIGPGKWMVSQPIRVNMQSSIVGAPIGMSVGGVVFPATNLVAANQANLAAVVIIGDGSDPGGFGASLTNIVVDGNKANNGTTLNTSAAILIQSARVDLSQVTAQNSNGDGIRVIATATTGACCGKFSKVMSIQNVKAGLHLVNSTGTAGNTANDTFVVQSEFENNDMGIFLEGASALRLSASDVGGNRVGISSSANVANGAAAWALILTGKQFGNQKEADIQLGSGGLHTISGNQFIGSSRRIANQPAIQIWGSSGAVVSGNTINMLGNGGQNLAYGIQFVLPVGKNLASGNVVQGGTLSNSIVGASNTTGGRTPTEMNLID
jgi:hypothetical protein